MGAILSCLRGSSWDSHEDERAPLLNGFKYNNNNALDDDGGNFHGGASDLTRRGRRLDQIRDYVCYHLLDISRLEQFDTSIVSHRSAKDFRRAFSGRKSHSVSGASGEDAEDTGDQLTDGNEDSVDGTPGNTAINSATSTPTSTTAERTKELQPQKQQQPLPVVSGDDSRTDSANSPTSAKEARARLKKSQSPVSPKSGRSTSRKSSLQAKALDATPDSLAGAIHPLLFDDWEVVTTPIPDSDHAWIAQKSKGVWAAYTQEKKVEADGPLLLNFA